MTAVVERVSRARVMVGEQTAGEINTGLLVLLGVAKDDDKGDVEYIVRVITSYSIHYTKLYERADDRRRLELFA